MSFALKGQDYMLINTDDFNLENMPHINLKASFNFLKPSNGIVTTSDYWIKSLLIVLVIMSEEHLLTKFALPFIPRIEEGFDCFLWANRRWFENLEKCKGNIINNCKIIL
jgi:hypothetical protein